MTDKISLPTKALSRKQVVMVVIGLYRFIWFYVLQSNLVDITKECYSARGRMLLHKGEWSRKNINAIEFIFVSRDKVESHVVDYGLEERYLNVVNSAWGTRFPLVFKPSSKTSFQMYCVSSNVTISHGKQLPLL